MTQFVHRAAAFLLREAPGGDLGASPVLLSHAPPYVCMNQFADEASIDVPLHPAERGVSPLVEVDRMDDARALGSLQHLAAVRRSQGERLLTEHVLPGFGRVDRDLLV